MHVEIRKYKKRTTGHKIDDTVGELSNTGNEMLFAILNAFFLRSLLSINNILSLFCFGFLTH